MRVWVIVPITKEMRVGAALGSETMFVRKNVHWTHFLSPIGEKGVKDHWFRDGRCSSVLDGEDGG